MSVIDSTSFDGTANNALFLGGIAASRFSAFSSLGTTGQVLTSNGSATYWADGGAINLQEFTSSGTWTKPTGARFVMVEAWGGGGGGASGRRGASDGSTYNGGGTGGGGGAFVRQVYKASDLPSTVTVTVGAGGAGGAAVTANSTNGNDGTSGGTSTFGSLITARGGVNGVATSSTGGTGTGAYGGQGGQSIPGTIVAGFSTGTADISWPASFGPMLYRASERYDVNVPSAGYAGGSGGGVGSARDAYAGGGSLLGGAGGGAGGGSTVNGSAKISAAGGCDNLENGGGGTAGGLFGIAGGAGGARQGGGGGGTGFGVPTAARQDCITYSTAASKFYMMLSTGNYFMEFASDATPNYGAPTFRFTGTGTPTCFRIFNNVHFVCTSTGVWSSSDMVTWTQRYVGNVKFIAFGGGRYVVCGTNLFAWSTDYINWNNVTAYTDTFTRVRHDGTRFVAAAPNNVWISTDGVTWTSNSKPADTKYMTDVLSNGSRIVTKAYDAPSRNAIPYGNLYYSDDWGATWTLTAGTGDREGYLSSELAEYAIGRFNFAIYSSAGNISLATSTNATSWILGNDGQNGLTDSGPGFSGVPVNGIAFNPSTTAVVVSRASNGLNFRSYFPITASPYFVTAGNAVMNSTVGGIGGAGGAPGGGGGGGGAALNGNNSGAGGAGAAGAVRVYSW